MGTFAETSDVDYCFRLATKENKIPFSVSVFRNKRKFAIFRLHQTNGTFSIDSVFCLRNSGNMET